MRNFQLILSLFICLNSSISFGFQKNNIYPDFLTSQTGIQWENQNLNQLFSSVRDQYPELRVIVLDQLNPEFSDENLISYQDNAVSKEAYKYYFDFMQEKLQGVGFFLAPHLRLNNQVGSRPLEPHPLVVLRKNAPRHALIHELGHFLIYQWQLENGVIFENSSLQQLYESALEEIVVDLQILNQVNQLGFTNAETCSRVLYLNQNRQVAESNLKEINKHELSSQDLELYKLFYEYVGQSRKMSHKWQQTCFLLKYKKS